jgi:hypothetical protein
MLYKGQESIQDINATVWMQQLRRGENKPGAE